MHFIWLHICIHDECLIWKKIHVYNQLYLLNMVLCNMMIGIKWSYATATAKSLQSCPTLHNPIDSSLSGSPVPGILQARILEWLAISFSNAWKWKMKLKSLSRVRLFSELMDCSLPGSPIHGIFQTRVLEWGAISFSENEAISKY